jgi:hypothetical protein
MPPSRTPIVFRFVADDAVSIWTLAGQMKISFVCGELLAFRKDEVHLQVVRSEWYVAGQKFSLRRAGLRHCGTTAAKRRVVDPRNTSRTCRECGSLHIANRKSQKTFSLYRLRVAAADLVGGRNIRPCGGAALNNLRS